MLNPMHDKSENKYRWGGGKGREDACDYGLSRRSRGVKPLTYQLKWRVKVIINAWIRINPWLITGQVESG